MLHWRYLRFKGMSHQEDTLKLIETSVASKISQLAPGPESIDLDALIREMRQKAERFFVETTTTEVWEHVPDDKKIRDWKYMSAVLFRSNNFDTVFGTDAEILDQINGRKFPKSTKNGTVPTQKSSFAALFDKLDQEREERPMPPQKNDRGYTFIHALDLAVLFAEQEQYTQQQATNFLRELLSGKALFNALYLQEMLNHPERLGWQRGDDPTRLGLEINQNYAQRKDLADSQAQPFFKLDGEAEIAQEFLRTKQKGLELPHKLAVHAVDGQLGWRAWRTYEEIPQRTASNLASIATYGLVAGGVAGWVVVPTILMGTVDRADLCIMNYDTQHQGAVIAPIEEYARPGFKVEFPYSLAVMIDSRKEGGIDILVEPSPENVLPSIPPKGLIIVAPTSLEPQITERIYQLSHLLRQSPEETRATLAKGICYDPSLWGDFHNFNEWLQTTSPGKEILEEKLGKHLSELKTMEEIKGALHEGYVMK